MKKIIMFISLLAIILFVLSCKYLSPTENDKAFINISKTQLEFDSNGNSSLKNGLT